MYKQELLCLPLIKFSAPIRGHLQSIANFKNHLDCTCPKFSQIISLPVHCSAHWLDKWFPCIGNYCHHYSIADFFPFTVNLYHRSIVINGFHAPGIIADITPLQTSLFQR